MQEIPRMKFKIVFPCALELFVTCIRTLHGRVMHIHCAGSFVASMVAPKLEVHGADCKG